MGEHLCEKTGSIIKLASLPNDIIAVECPIHVYVILSYELGKEGVTIGNYSSNNFKSVGIPLFSLP